MTPRKHYSIALPGRAPLDLGARTLVMGIINVTPDSFADGGRRFDHALAIADGLKMIADGADILDVGGESTRPGAEPVDAGEELRRVLPVVEALARDGRVPVSIDTYKAAVARDAVAAGATIVNDVSGLQYDADLAPVVAGSGAALVLMHNRGRSAEMYRGAVYEDVAGEIGRELEAAIGRATRGGIARDRLILDPGFGFAKRAEHTWESLAQIGPAGRARSSDTRRTVAQVVPDGGDRRPFARRARLGDGRGSHGQRPCRRPHRPRPRRPRDGRRRARLGSPAGARRFGIKLRHGHQTRITRNQFVR